MSDRPGSSASVADAIAAACHSIAPAWPLDRWIAVNPHWGRIDRDFQSVAEGLSRITGSRPWMPAEYYAEAWRSGDIAREDLVQALGELESRLTVDDLVSALASGAEPRPSLPLLSDGLDLARDAVHQATWRETILHQVSQHCAAWFDRDQADWALAAGDGLYASWLQEIRHDHGIASLMETPLLVERARSLPGAPQACIAAVVQKLGVPAPQIGEWLEAVLGRVHGWASWCAYLSWDARLEGGSADPLVDLLAIRVAWEALVDDGERTPGSPWHRWQQRLTHWAAAQAPLYERVAPLWQRAHEIAYQRRLLDTLSKRPAPSGDPVRDAVQAVFCIDVRSEGLRRALEETGPSLRTLGFAGFFGLPIAHRLLGTSAERRLLPGLLPPSLVVAERSDSASADIALAATRGARLGAAAAWRPFDGGAVSAFTRVETLGLGDLPRLLARTLGLGSSTPPAGRAGLKHHEWQRLRPELRAEVATQIDLGEQVLRAMNLVSGHARLVLLVGHGSRSCNNPHAAALDCGACGGHPGDVNARVLAHMLNDDAVRAGLRARGIDVPDDTRFVPALHDTTTDEMTLFDVDTLPASHAVDLAGLRDRLAAASDRARSRRAASLGLGALAARPRRLRSELERRAVDWAETRPEWGLADNAAFIVAPRARTVHADLGGRAFLHEYDWRNDQGGRVLELIMTAPMVVAHWINLQYYASTVDPERYGSGNKLLHNVVGGRIGVFEGNGGDLRIGLPRQSVHDGARWRHAPLRLTVVIEAPRAMIDHVIAKHEVVRHLVSNRWLHLWRYSEGGFEVRGTAGWDVVDAGASPAAATLSRACA